MGKNASQPGRKELLERLTQAVYENSTAAVFFHTAIAEQIGLGATEEKTLLILSGGALTAGEIAQYTGLTTGSVTSLIDRLEKKGFVRRVRDTHDRRRVMVEVDAARFADLSRIFASLQGVFEGLFDSYSDEQLTLIADFLSRSTALSRQAIARLNQSPQRHDQSEK